MNTSWIAIASAAGLCASISLSWSATVAEDEAAGGVRDLFDIEVPGAETRVRTWSDVDPEGRVRAWYAVASAGESFGEPRRTDYALHLRRGSFDPLLEELDLPESLEAAPGSRTWIVQFRTPSMEGFRRSLREQGAEILLFLAQHSHGVRVDPARLDSIRALPFVRAVSALHPGFKLDEALLHELEQGRSGELRLNLLTMRRGGQAPVADWVTAHGGHVESISEATHLMRLRLDRLWIAELAALEGVQWIEPHGEPGMDTNIAREFHGAQTLQTVIGLSGLGIRVEVLDQGVDTSHPAFQRFLIHNGNSPSFHGTSVAGIVVGSGVGEPPQPGILPDATLVIADFGFAWAGGSRYAHTAELVDPNLPYRCVLQTNSWGGSRTNSYGALSHDMDLMLFDLEHLSITQSMGNAGVAQARPEAWAKNVISVGGISHENTLTIEDDSWGFASIGPAADGRIKPDLASFYDQVSAPQMGGGYNASFGGNSASTAITAGHLGLFYSLWDLGLFGNANGGLTPFENAPNNTTAKAIAINTAGQWPFSGVNHNLTRVHQGWGWIDLERMLELSDQMLVVDESDVLSELETTSYFVEVPAATPELKVTLVYRDPPGAPFSIVNRINDLDLTVISPGGTVYPGNQGLSASPYSTPGGASDTLNTVENVFVALPGAGTWEVRVGATEVAEDAHVETAAVDVDYALVVSGIEVERPPHRRRVQGPPTQR